MADHVVTQVVDNVLQKADEEAAKFKPTKVDKDLDLEIDVGNLLACDPNIINIFDYNKNLETYLKELTRDNTQLLINKIWELPSQTFQDAVVVKLPAGKTVLPREKRVPKVKPMTRWEEYAKKKGIEKKKKKENLVWDEAVKDWRPQYGFKRVNNIKDDWVIEVPENLDPNTDMFAKKKEAKKERTAKNELQRLKNIARTQNLKTKFPASGLAPTEKLSKQQVSKALIVAKSSTASVGKFTDKLPEEKPARKLGKKRKFEENLGDITKEKAKSMRIFESLSKKNPVLDVNAAVNTQAHQEETERSQRKEGKKGPSQSKKTRGRKGIKTSKASKRKPQKIKSRMKGKHT